MPGQRCEEAANPRSLSGGGPRDSARPPEPHQVRGRDRDPGLYDLQHPSALGPARSSAAEPPRRFYLAIRAPAGAGPRFRDGCTRRRPRVRDLTRYTRDRKLQPRRTLARFISDPPLVWTATHAVRVSNPAKRGHRTLGPTNPAVALRTQGARRFEIFIPLTRRPFRCRARAGDSRSGRAEA